MFPLASAKIVLFDELALYWAAICRKAAKSRALVRRNDWLSASIGAFMSATLIHFPPISRTIGP